MRIICGTQKGREIHPQHLSARPTTDIAKEGLFNILANLCVFEDIDVLDLFGGSGSITYEFASRGCQSVTCVEMNPIHAAFIIKTSQQLRFDSVRVIRLNVFDFFPICTKTYSLIFADPPYDLNHLEQFPHKIQTSGLLCPHGLFILEHSRSFDFSKYFGFFRSAKYGNVHFSFFIFDPPL